MRPDDPRHGTIAGRAAGCRDACCQRAQARYEKRRRLHKHRGTTLAVDPRGAQRRIQALQCLGWTSTDIARAAGWNDRQRVQQILDGQKGKPAAWIRRETDDIIRGVYLRLATSAPEANRYRTRTKTRAETLGWAPPAAWLDIDRDEAPDRRRTGPLTPDGLSGGRWVTRRGVARWEAA